MSVFECCLKFGFAAPEGENSEIWRRFGSMSCSLGRSERLDLRLEKW